MPPICLAQDIVQRGWCGGGSPDAKYMAALSAVDTNQRAALPAEHAAFLTRSEADAALAAFVILHPQPPPDLRNCAAPADVHSSQAGRRPIMGQTVSYNVVHLAQRYGISQDAAEAVLAHLKPGEGHRTNTLLARQTINRFARDNHIRFEDAEAVFRME